MRKVLMALSVLALSATLAQAQVGTWSLVDSHWESATLEGWTPYQWAEAGAPGSPYRVADRFLFNDPYQPPSGEHWGIGNDAWGTGLAGGAYLRYKGEYFPGEVRTITALCMAYSTDWSFNNPTPGDVGVRLGVDYEGGTDRNGVDVWTDWYWGQQWTTLQLQIPCTDAWETVFIESFGPWATGPMVGVFDWVHIEQPIPEPGSLVALGTGLLGLTGIAVRRRR
ncbi:MAG: PEP-CTERM sorting domain-containing protein [Armatimonadota bacterium]